MRSKTAVMLAMVLATGTAWGVDYKRVKPSASPECLGDTGYALAEEYCRQLPESRKVSPEILRLLKDDPDYRRGNAYLYDPSRYVVVDALLGDAEKPQQQKRGTRRMPDYKRAVESFHTSAVKRRNPVSAYEGLSLLKSFFPIGTKKNMRYRRDFAKILYEAKTCEGYLEWGDINAEGVLQKVDRRKALGIYNEGYGACRNVGWYGPVLGSRIERIKMALGREK